ncbi:MAG TPA: metallophosphoesterase, partial [Planctomycetota bacterium]|nr:metallophosphoesterase [Planctomycetota bacterium]
VTPIYSFKTAETSLYPYFRFVVFGDSGSGNSNQAAAASLVSALDPDLVLIAGDVIYSCCSASAVTGRYFVPYASLLPERPFYLALGNHDYDSGCGQPYLDNFCLPESAPGGERYYSFDRGNVHFVSADSNEVSSPPSACTSNPAFTAQLGWLDADLAGSAAPWKIVFFHHPPYSDSNHGDDPDVQASFVPIFEARKVDLAFAGHDHCYERFPQMIGGVPASGGVRYMVAGTGGASLYSITPGPLLEVGIVTHGALVGDVRGNQLRLRFYGSDPANYGQLLDEVLLSKGPTTPFLETSTSTVAPGGTLDLTLAAEPGGNHMIAFGLFDGYVEAPPNGIFLLNPFSFHIVSSGLVPPGGIVSLAVPVPFDPALSGITFPFQAFADVPNPDFADFRISNVVPILVN